MADKMPPGRSPDALAQRLQDVQGGRTREHEQAPVQEKAEHRQLRSGLDIYLEEQRTHQARVADKPLPPDSLSPDPVMSQPPLSDIDRLQQWITEENSIPAAATEACQRQGMLQPPLSDIDHLHQWVTSPNSISESATETCPRQSPSRLAQAEMPFEQQPRRNAYHYNKDACVSESATQAGPGQSHSSLAQAQMAFEQQPRQNAYHYNRDTCDYNRGRGGAGKNNQMSRGRGLLRPIRTTYMYNPDPPFKINRQMARCPAAPSRVPTRLYPKVTGRRTWEGWAMDDGSLVLDYAHLQTLCTFCSRPSETPVCPFCGMDA